MSDWPWKGAIRLPVDNQCAWGSWMAPLMACVCATDGAILEIGMGDWSTPFLHHYCACTNRLLLSIESDETWANAYTHLANEGHRIRIGPLDPLVKQAAIEQWAVALVDGSPSETRYRHCFELHNSAGYLVVHDFSGKECIETFTPSIISQWTYRAQAPRPRYSPSSLILGHQPIAWFPGIESL